MLENVIKPSKNLKPSVPLNKEYLKWNLEINSVKTDHMMVGGTESDLQLEV